MDPVGFENHDHHHCIADGVAAADAYCAQNGLQLTNQRRRVLEILLERHRALGAYEILDVLREEGMGSQPPVAYRALDFLQKHGFVHRIERLNAFIACSHPGARHSPAFLICRVCDSVAEASADPASGMLGHAAAETGFVIERAVVEAEGVCPNCKDAA
ncbi:Fur family transcriptional regulator [Psychromarinibacter halotolerans]|uniref:Fur family transcriptional regulator n=1 Tax=Psychromarinibacter halotolerans TaxID=1775175 RepID=A0ABV7GNW4_9RHOB|nr:Fur family transcriptional regulator [Psychromarinibacter halotolerans]MAQ83913.1 Fur family transcriptional regulator [Maritimibacter sp.]MDF0595386.1 Fur family transcriptional regulator [Psychromarinibacter halotolerans]